MGASCRNEKGRRWAGPLRTAIRLRLAQSAAAREQTRWVMAEHAAAASTWRVTLTPAVINAVVDALSDYGVTHIEMPVTAERVWRAIRQGKIQAA